MDDDQQFCLRWNNHQSTLISVFDTLLENGTLVDCTLAAEGKSMKAHKVVLSACSPYFANLLSQHYDKHPVFILKDVKYQELRAMMDYMYRGEVNISQDQLAALLKAAESLQIKGLSDNRSGGNNNNNAMNNKATENLVKPPPPVPAAKSTASGAAAGLTIENKRPLKSLLGVTADLDTDASVISREGSTSPSRKRKKTNVRRRSIESNNVLDNHEQLSNSSSHSTTHATNNITTSTTNVLPVTKKTDHHESKQTSGDGVGHDDAGGGADSANEDKSSTGGAGGKDAATHSELMIEPKNEYDDDDGTEPVEDLTLDDEDMMEDLDQAGPSHGGEGSSSGYGNWQMERSNDEFMTGQEAGQHRDAQGIKDGKDEVLTLADLNDCLLESNDIVVSKTKTGIVLLKLKKEQVGTKLQQQQLQRVEEKECDTVLQECEIRPVSTNKKPQKLVEKAANVTIVPVSQNPVATTILPQQVVERPKLPQLITTPQPIKKASHPRIKYSKVFNPVIQQPQLTKIELPQTSTTPPQQTQYLITRKVTQATPSSSTVNVQQQQQQQQQQRSIVAPTILKVFTDYEGNSSIATIPTQQASTSDFAVSVIDDLDYTGIEDIELPDVNFSDSFKQHDQSNNSVSSNSNDHLTASGTIAEKYTIYPDGTMQRKYDANPITDASLSDQDDGKQYACQHCGKRYRWKSTLRRHESVECGGKDPSHQCPYCPYKAKQRGNLGVHVRKHHSNLPPLITRRNKNNIIIGN